MTKITVSDSMTNLLTESFANHQIVLSNSGSLISNQEKKAGKIVLIHHNAH